MAPWPPGPCHPLLLCFSTEGLEKRSCSVLSETAPRLWDEHRDLGDTGCSSDSQRLPCEWASLQNCLRKPPGHVRCETPQGRTTCSTCSCKGRDAPWGDKLDGNSPPALPSPTLAGPQPWGHQQNPIKPHQPGELVYGIYSLGAFIGKKKKHYGLQVSRRTAAGGEHSLPFTNKSWLEYNCNPPSVLAIPALTCHVAFPGSS